MSQYMEVEDAAEFLGYKPVTVRRLVKKGVLTAYSRPGTKRHQYKKSELVKVKELKPVQKIH